MSALELFWSSSMEELKKGFIDKNDKYICLLCGKEFEKEIIYPEGSVLYKAERYMRIHIEKTHKSVFEYLINMDKKLTGLSEHQKNLLLLFYCGKSDAEVQKEMNIGSASTIRNHRFILKEKERQSRLFLTMMELLREKDKCAPTFIDLPNTARMIDDRYNITEDEKNKILNKYFPEGTDGPLKTFVLKEKQRLVVLTEIAKRFQIDKIYNEKEVNQILKTAYEDYVIIRRYLIEYGFLDRKADGSQYWLK